MATNYEALAREFGGTVEPANDAGGMGTDANGRPVLRVNIPRPKPAEEVDYAALASEFGGTVEPVRAVDVPPSEFAPDTTAEGVFGAATRGLAPALGGAAIGAAIGAPIAGVGAIPGALAGAAAGTLAEFAGDPIVTGVNSLLGTNFATPSEALGNLLTAIGVPEAQTEAERIIQSAASAAGGAAGGVGLGRVLAQGASAVPTVAQGVGEALAAMPGAQLAGGAASGAAAQIVAEAGGDPLAQLAAGVAGGVAGGRMVPRQRQPLPTIVQEAEAANVPLMTSDVLPPRTFAGRSMQATGERIPLAGTGPVREAQQQARIAAVRDVVQDYAAADASALPERLVADLARERSKTIQQYSAAKNDVIERLASAGEVPMEAANRRIDSLVADLRRRKTREGDEAAAVLTTIKDDLQGRNLFELEAYRRDVLANVFKDDPTRPMSIAVREAGEKALREIYDPVRQDMGAFIQANGDRRDFAKWMIANKRLSQEAGQLANATLKSVLRTGDATPESVERLLFSSKPSDVAALYRNLSSQGRAVARQAIIARAAAKATAKGETEVSPTRFANEIDALGKSIGVFFKGDELARVQGLARVLSATKRASEAAAFPATGVQNVLPTAAIGGVGAFGGGFSGFLGAMAAAGAIGASARIYESAPVRNLLLQASKTTNNDRLIEIGQRINAVMQADTAQQSETAQ